MHMNVENANFDVFNQLSGKIVIFATYLLTSIHI